MVFRQAGMVLVVLATIGVTSGRVQSAKPEPEPATGIGLVTPGSDPGSVRIVQDLALVLADETLGIRPVRGADPVQTVSIMLKDRGATVGIVPADVLPYLGRRPNAPDAGDKLRYIARLYDEDVHVLARRDIPSLTGLDGYRVNVGLPDSRTRITSTILFTSLGISVEPTFADEPIALAQLLRGEIAALVHVGRKPARLFFDLNRGDGVHFLPIPLSPALSQTYSPSQLGIADYPLLIGASEAGRGAPIGTVAVSTVLAVVDPELPPGEWTPGYAARSSACSGVM
ncbi:TAXI family TRAP transporter solute-binding subunit [Azospirillum canadense]|uniref:TAXI family TRAP transporter solute-binding subunit n=1 Tax=Azospirillum canadense TaxID=403962 RepID=UPI0022261CF2|nr:TAXI family TRAP transporter solute-binding subunit [Azospirillum canadense]MCW2239106.1 TRAP-type uncharacterized transport system substrate-binding protein [Azospirillum canadense]